MLPDPFRYGQSKLETTQSSGSTFGIQDKFCNFLFQCSFKSENGVRPETADGVSKPTCSLQNAGFKRSVRPWDLGLSPPEKLEFRITVLSNSSAFMQWKW